MVVVERWNGKKAGALRQALRMTTREFAEYLGAAPRTVAKWDSMGSAVVPTPVMQSLLDTALSRASDEVRIRFALMSGTPVARTAGWEASGPEETAVDRREATSGLLALLATAASAPVGALSRVVSQRVGRVDAPLVASHQEWFDALSGIYRMTDQRVLLPVISGYADSVLTLLDSPMNPSDRTRLMAVAVGAHTAAGVVAFNSGQWPGAYRSLAVARSLADDLDDPALRAQTIGTTGFLYSSALRGGLGGDRAKARTLFAQALAILPRSDGLVRAKLIAWRADESAAQGDVAAALDDLELADHALTSPGLPRGFLHLEGMAYNVQGHLDGIRSQVDALNGRVGEAEQGLTQVLARARGPKQRAIAFTRLAGVRVQAADPEGAAGALAQAHQLTQQVGYRLGEQRVRGVRVRFDQRWARLGPVVELDERLGLTA